MLAQQLVERRAQRRGLGEADGGRDLRVRGRGLVGGVGNHAGQHKGQ
jgi:hypothetical protein